MRDPERELIHSAIARMRGGIMAIVFGAVGAVALFLATAVLLVQGGVDVGLHLGRLRWYLPGYTVSWPGALLGGAYGALLGAIVGWSVAWLYNTLALAREDR